MPSNNSSSQIRQILRQQIIDLETSCFEDLALQIFRYQAQFNSVYNDYLTYLKTDVKTNNTLLIVVNLDVTQTHSASLRIPLETLPIDSSSELKVSDLLSGDTYYWRGEWQYVELNPYLMPAHIFKIEY